MSLSSEGHAGHEVATAYQPVRNSICARGGEHDYAVASTSPIWGLDRISPRLVSGKAQHMRTPLPTEPTRRDADNGLYDHGCDLVAAASAIRRAAGAPEATRAVPAVLGCMESALQELMWAAVALEQTSADHLEQNAHEHPSARTWARWTASRSDAAASQLGS